MDQQKSRRDRRQEGQRRRWRGVIVALAALVLVLAVGVTMSAWLGRRGEPAPQVEPTVRLTPEPTPQATPASTQREPAPANPMAQVDKGALAAGDPDGVQATEAPQGEAEVTAQPGAASVTPSPEASGASPSASASSPEPVAALLAPELEVTAKPQELALSGYKIGIDPGHQKKANNQKEPIAPGSSKTKKKVSSGTAGVTTRRAEHEVNLEVSFQLKEALEAQGAQVFMTRETADIDISNVERAQMMNELGVDLCLRIHCNGSENKKMSGIGLYIRKTGTNQAACQSAAEALLPAMVEATGAKDDGIHLSDTYTGLNWSEAPCILVEMGYMSNPEEDVLLNDPAYQQKLVSGMVNGVVTWIYNCQAGVPEATETPETETPESE